MQQSGSFALSCERVAKEFKSGPQETVRALDSVSLSVPRGAVMGQVGPDGAGKTTLIRIATGLLVPEAGSMNELGINVASDPQTIQSGVGYMPQKFGLYEDLTVQKNHDLCADLHGVSTGEGGERYPRLMNMTGLSRFTGHLAGRLSGGMKQKLGLACTLVRSPDLFLLDEPTVGVDPLAKRELWEIVYRLVKEQGLTGLLSTACPDEAECLKPRQIQARLAGAPCALMHEPEILFLDEPTSGMHPPAHREFRHRIGGLADEGVTVIVTPHAMEEAEHCDLVVIMVDGEIPAVGIPSDIRDRARVLECREPTIAKAFIAIVEDYRRKGSQRNEDSLQP